MNKGDWRKKRHREMKTQIYAVSPAILCSCTNLLSPWSFMCLVQTLNVKGMFLLSPICPPLISKSIPHYFIFRNHGKIYSFPVVQKSLRLNLCRLCIILIIQKSNILCQHKRKENKLISLNNNYKMLQDIHRPPLSSQAMLDPDNTGKLPKALSEMNRSLALFLQNLL